jgi:hypothetical protein
MNEREEKSDTCYLLIGGADGALDVTLLAAEGKVAALKIAPKTGFGGMIWLIIAQMLIGVPLEKTALDERIYKMIRSGLIPEELELEPLVKTLIKLGKT